MEEKDYGQLAAELENYVNSKSTERQKVSVMAHRFAIQVMAAYGEDIYCVEDIMKFVNYHRLNCFFSVSDDYRAFIYIF